MNKRRTQKIERRKIEILKSAASVFNKKGYHNTTMEDISEKLLMTKGSLYYYFKNKEQLLYVCHDYSLGLLTAELEKVRRRSDPPDEKLRALILNHVRLVTDELNSSAMHIEFDVLTPPLLKKIIAKRDYYEKGLRQIIQEGIERGVFRSCDPKLAAFAILGAINWIPKWFSAAGEYNWEQIGPAFADHYIRGLKRDSRADVPLPAEELPLPGLNENAYNGNSSLQEETWLL
jgi:AcrR family transcriptional regulator